MIVKKILSKVIQKTKIKIGGKLKNYSSFINDEVSFLPLPFSIKSL